MPFIMLGISALGIGVITYGTIKKENPIKIKDTH